MILSDQEQFSNLSRRSERFEAFLRENHISPKTYWQKFETLQKQTSRVLDCASTEYGKQCRGKCCIGCGVSIGYLYVVPVGKIKFYMDLFSRNDGTFRGEAGCILPRELRSIVCTIYHCYNVSPKRTEDEHFDSYQLFAHKFDKLRRLMHIQRKLFGFEGRNPNFADDVKFLRKLLRKPTPKRRPQ